MSRIRRGYKILWKADRGSIIAGNTEGFHYRVYSDTEARVIYSVNEWVRPNKGHGPLAVFAQQGDVDSFLMMNCSRLQTKEIIVVECEFRKSSLSSLWCLRRKTKMRSWCLPDGTILASSVRCLQ